MTEPTKRSVDQRARKEVAVDHQFLELALSWLASARQEGAIASMADDLTEYLEKHFEAEEREGGFYAAVLERAPRHESAVVELRAEHRSLLDQLTSLRKGIEAPYKEASATTLEAVASFVEAMRNHEKREYMLLDDALERDFGSGD